ncbi:MAG: lipase family protein [Gammaproteobacteria bacterium]
MKYFPLSLGLIFTVFSMFYTSVFASNQQRGQLVSSQILTTLNVSTIESTLAQVSLKPIRPVQPVQIYKIIYQTKGLDGNLSKASAQVAVPLKSGPFSILCYHHGTVTLKNKSPSSLTYDSGLLHAGYFGGAGHLVVVQPDYLGLGENNEVIHPYLQEESLASASVDAILATKAFLQKIKVSSFNSVFLAGYSEGGFATLATQKLIENNYPNIKIRAVAAGAGPYLFRESIYYTLTTPGLSASLFTAYYLYAYHKTHGYWSNLSDVFNSPYDQLIPVLLNGHHDQDEIASKLPPTPKSLLKPYFYDQLVSLSEPHIHEIIDSLNFHHWSPQAPVALIGAKADTDVPFFNAEILSQYWEKRGIQSKLINVGDALGHYDGKFKSMEAQLYFLITSKPV